MEIFKFFKFLVSTISNSFNFKFLVQIIKATFYRKFTGTESKEQFEQQQAFQEPQQQVLTKEGNQEATRAHENERGQKKVAYTGNDYLFYYKTISNGTILK